MNSKVKRISEGAMMLAIIGLFLLLNLMSATFMESALYWIISFPIIIYTLKYGMKSGYLLSFCALTLTLLLSSFTTIFYVCSSVMVGLIYSYGLIHKKGSIYLLVSTFIVNLITNVLTMIVFASLFGFEFSQTINEVTTIMTSMNMNIPNNITQLVMIGFCLSIIVLVILQTLCVHVVSSLLLKRLELYNVEAFNIMELRLHKSVAIISILIIAVYHLAMYYGVSNEIELVLFSLYMIVTIINIFIGVIVILIMLVANKKGNLSFLLGFAIFIPIINSIIMYIGIFDTLFNVRYKLKDGGLIGKIRKP